MKCQVSFRPKTWYLHSKKITDVNYIIKIAPFDAALLVRYYSEMI